MRLMCPTPNTVRNPGRELSCLYTVIYHNLILISLVPSVTATIFVSGSRVIGESVTLTCNATVTGLSSLANDTTIEFSGPSGVTTGTGTSLQLPLNPAVISDAGQYTCVATVTSTLLDSDVNDTVTEDLRLQSECSHCTLLLINVCHYVQLWR